MSVIKNELQKLANRAGGAFKTVSDRESMAGRIADALKAANIQISSIEHLKSKHIESYIQGRLQDGIGKRTLQNEMSSMRGILREAGRDTLADSERISNKSLGIDNASRNGTHLAMPNDMYNCLIERLDQVDKGVSACAQLERWLGLRGEEAVQSNKSLLMWEKQLSKDDTVRVIYGTKGGRPRDVRIVDVARAREAIKYGRERMRETGGMLINKKGLKSAMDRYAYVMRTNGCTGEYSPHSLRYAYACDSIDRYEAQGYSHKDALAQTSQDLGHGDGRGRYIAQVYLRK